jgi:hypothetical protein
MHFVSEAWVSLLQGASGAFRRELHWKEKIYFQPEKSNRY